MTTTDLVGIIDSLAAAGKIFSNEQDFQFTLGLELKKHPDVEEIWFEVPSFENDVLPSLASLSKCDREYTDLIVRLKAGEYIGIELKYKTTSRVCFYQTKGSGQVITLKQGAYDFGAYGFLNDVFRLDGAKKRHFPRDITLIKGFAILLTNDKNYRFNPFSKSAIWSNYSICQSKGSIGPGLLAFGGNDPLKYLNFKALSLIKKYDLAKGWHDYALNDINGVPYSDYQDLKKTDNPGFSYLILEI